MKDAGHYLGRAHFYRDRGAGYIDGVRTSLQVGFIGAGVLKGAGFTDAFWAIVVGFVTVLILESAKIVGGWIDYRLGAISVQQRAIGWETNPAESRKIELLESIERHVANRP